MTSFAEAIIEVPREGLINVEQRKRVTIGVELAAKPELLLFSGTSEERKPIEKDLVRTKHELSYSHDSIHESSSNEFATSLPYQISLVTRRNFELDWRTPAYSYSQFFLTLGAGLINGFSLYNPQASLQGVQNQIFSTFPLLTLHKNLVQLTLPHLMDNRTLYEARERSSKTYS
ncbi:hypothetical protein ABEW05_000635 [Botrytis cinerea]